MAKQVDWSRVGRSSRRLGKAFECETAGLLREWTGCNWQTTRNSGRTDLPGDVYCVDRPGHCVVECKRREDFSPRHWLLGTLSYRTEINDVLDKWLREQCRLPGCSRLVVLAKVPLLATFAAVLQTCESRPYWFNVSTHGSFGDPGAGVRCAVGIEWHVLPPVLDGGQSRDLLYVPDRAGR